MSIIVIVSFVILFCFYFLCSQIIYSKNYFTFLFIITLSLPLIFLLFFKNEKMLVIINTGLLCFYYSLLLFLIKKGYKKINKKFIQQGLIDVEYSNKDFTYVLWDGDIPTVGNWWNEKLASKPSWLDHLFTYLLLIIPILFFWIVNLFDTGG